MEVNPIISQEEMTGLLGRPLQSVEIQNYDLYLQIAVLKLEDLLCIKLSNVQPIPADLKLVIARCFALNVEEQNEVGHHGINRKQVEDFSISYETDADSPMVNFVKLNSTTLDKYSQCQGEIRSGKVRCGDCFRCV